MIFNKHLDLKGQHALFSPSQSAWLRYDENKITDRIISRYRAPLGTEIHEYAANQIKLDHKITSIKNLIIGIENYIYTKYSLISDDLEYGFELLNNLNHLPKEVYEAVKCYINDAIGYKMTVEQPLVYSNYIYGTADAISYRNNFLRIHDLKTGSIPAHIEQLETYAALFCLEYDIKPKNIGIELRLYQLDGIEIINPDIEIIFSIINKIIEIEKIASKLTYGEN